MSFVSRTSLIRAVAATALTVLAASNADAALVGLSAIFMAMTFVVFVGYGAVA